MFLCRCCHFSQKNTSCANGRSRAKGCGVSYFSKKAHAHPGGGQGARVTVKLAGAGAVAAVASLIKSKEKKVLLVNGRAVYLYYL